MSNQVRVVVVDDHPMVRAGLTAQLAKSEQVIIAGEAGTVAEAATVLADAAPDVVLVDHQLPDGHGLDLLARIGAAGPAVVLVTAFDDRPLITQYLNSGAAGFVHKSSGPDELVRCVLEAAAGRSALDPASVHRTMLAPTTPDANGDLSARELDVLRLVADGLTNDAIGRGLNISSQTVKTHLSRIYAKLGVSDRAQAAVVATRRALL